jgi:hypothetical protein
MLSQEKQVKLVIFDANRRTGRIATEQALAEGHTVVAVARRLPLAVNRPVSDRNRGTYLPLRPNDRH